jgi:hypothetical protein
MRMRRTHILRGIFATGLLLMAVAVANVDKAMTFGPTTIDSGDGFYAESTPVHFNLVPPLTLIMGVGFVIFVVVKWRQGGDSN